MSDMTKAELEAELRQARDKICYCECKNKELQERLSAIVAPVQCDTYAEAVRAYGKQSQLVMAMEEMSELTKELSKNLRGADNSKALAEEIADVEIMLEQLKVIFRNRALVDRIRAGKLVRLSDRIITLYEGEITGQFQAGSISKEEIGYYMTGSRRKEAAPHGKA